MFGFTAVVLDWIQKHKSSKRDFLQYKKKQNNSEGITVKKHQINCPRVFIHISSPNCQMNKMKIVS